VSERRHPHLLGVAPATALVIAAMVGTGVFTTTGVVLPLVGSPLAVLAIWAVSGVLALCGAAAYAELGAMMPRAGGEYVYLTRAFHPAVGFMAGWLALLVGFAAPTAAGALAFGKYLHAATPAVPQQGAAFALIVALTVAHMADVRFGALVQTVVTALVLILIAAFVGGAALSGRGDLANLASSVPAVEASSRAGGIALGLVYVGYAYFGWNSIAYVAGEVRDPGRTLPRALVAGTGLVTLLYLALNFVFVWAAPAAALSGRIEVAHVAATALFGARAAALLSVLVAMAVAGCVGAMMLAGPRILVAMAEDGLFLRALARRSARGAPTAAVVLQGALAMAIALGVPFDRILVYVGFTLNLTAGASVAAVFVLRRRAPDADRPHRALGWPVSGLLFLALVTAMTVFAIRDRPWESAAGFATIVVGCLAYLRWGGDVRPRTAPRT
jgi:APA family basic amino acid/polyamine antiporter